VLFASWGHFVNPDVFGLTFAASAVVYVLIGGRLTLIGGFVGALTINYLTSYLGEMSPAASTEALAFTGIFLEIIRRIIEQAPILVQGAVLVITVLLLKDGITPPLIRQLDQRPMICWFLLLPAVTVFSVIKVACRQAGFCLF